MAEGLVDLGGRERDQQLVVEAAVVQPPAHVVHLAGVHPLHQRRCLLGNIPQRPCQAALQHRAGSDQQQGSGEVAA
ncbi:MAG: hypothetical protein ACYS5W_11475 [Planctomycetota bacterium]